MRRKQKEAQKFCSARENFGGVGGICTPTALPKIFFLLGNSFLHRRRSRKHFFVFLTLFCLAGRSQLLLFPPRLQDYSPYFRRGVASTTVSPSPVVPLLFALDSCGFSCSRRSLELNFLFLPAFKITSRFFSARAQNRRRLSFFPSVADLSFGPLGFLSLPPALEKGPFLGYRQCRIN